MSPVSSDPHSCLSAHGVFHTRGPPHSVSSKTPALPSLCPPAFPLPILLRGWAAAQGQEWEFGMESSEFLRKVTNSGHPGCRLRDGRSEPSPHPACFASHPPGARLSMGLSCFTAYLSFHSPDSLVGGTGEAAPEGSTQEPDTVRGAEGGPLWLGHVLGDCLGVIWPLAPRD